MQTEPTTAPATTEAEQNRKLFQEYAQIRWQLSILDARKQELEPLVIEAALSVLGSGESPNGKSVVYRSENADILLQLRTTEPKDSEYPDLEHLAQMLDIERSKALHANQTQIAKVQREIAVLEAVLVGLENTPQGLEYAAEYAELKESLTSKKPVLVVKLR
jgi:hypothetical protein